MADITQDIAWMQRMARSSAVRERDLALEQALEYQAQQAAMRPYYQDPCGACGHRNHSVGEYGVVWCPEASCLCGVDPCPECGNYERHGGNARWFRCARCGHWWPVGAIA